jgi:hypothetical protein
MSNVVATLTRSEIEASVIASAYNGTAYLSNSGVCLTTQNKLEGVQMPASAVGGSGLGSSKRAFNPLKAHLNSTRSRKRSGKRIRKNLIKNRCDAFARLDRSRKFLAFYTVSFPAGLSDEACFRCLNKWLTRIRSWRVRFPYLWVAERQKNGTIHFHLLTNMFLPIKVVNGFMGIAIRNDLKKEPGASINFNSSIYNGVDVSRVKSPKQVIKYISKYVTKELADQVPQVWHCSRVFSKLAVALTVHAADAHYLISKLVKHQLSEDLGVVMVSNEFFLYVPLLHGPPDVYRSAMYSGNNQRFEEWRKN